MTKRHEQELTEREFEDFLEGRSEVARGYDRLRDVEPPQALDRAVLERARAAASGPRRRPAFWSHWSSRLAVAAVVVLAVAVTLQLRPGPETIPVAMDEGAGSGAAGSVTMDDSASPAPAVAEGAPARSGEGYADNTGPRAPEEGERVSGSTEQTVQHELAMEESAIMADSATTMPSRAEIEASAALLGATADEADPEARGAQRRLDLLAAYDSHRAPQRAAAESLAMSAKSASAPPSAPSARPSWREDPDDWLILVDALLEAGREAEARAELAGLVETWPDHPVDPRYGPWLPAPGTEEAAR